MAANTVIVEIDVNTGKAVQRIDDVSAATKKAESGASGLGGALEKSLGPVGGMLKGMKSGVMDGVKAFQTLRGALIATGIGALVVALGAVVSYFTSTEKGAEKLRVVMAALGVITAKLRDAFSGLGEKIVWAFEHPKEAVLSLWESIKTNIANRIEGLKDMFIGLGEIIAGVFELDTDRIKAGAAAFGESWIQTMTGVDNLIGKVKDSFSEFVTEVMDAVAVMTKMEKAMIALEKRERAYTVSREKANRQIAEARLMAQDTNLTFEERIGFLEKAIELEIQQADIAASLARERANIHAQQIAQSESTKEDYDEQARLQAAAIQAETASFMRRKELAEQLRSLKRQQADEAAAIAKEAADKEKQILEDLEEIRRALILDAQQKELDDNEIHFQALMEKAQGNYELMNELLDAQLLKEQEIKDKYRLIEEEKARVAAEKQKALDKQVADSKIALAGDVIGLVSELTENNEKGNDARARRAFRINKAAAIATTLANTYLAAQGAYASQVSLPDPSAPIRAAIAAGVAVASGLSRVRKIAQTQFGGGGSGGGGGGGGGGVSGFGAPQAQGSQPQLNLDTSFLKPQPAYVIGQNVTNEQQLANQINQKARL